MEKLNFKKWYYSRSSIEILLFVMPPLGLYGLYRNKSIKSPNVKFLYGTIGVITCFIFMMLVSKNF